MAKRALLVGCNYPNSTHKLSGCINDVHAVKAMLKGPMAFVDKNITVLIDTDEDGEQPTGANIKARLADLVEQSEKGDVLFFHFSGHGTQVKSTDKEAGEKDHQDEAIVPTDMNLITDDDLRKILAQLPDGVKFTMVADCCHSGTLLDQPRVEIAGPKEDDPDPPPLAAAAAADDADGTAAKKAKKGRGCDCRRLPIKQVADALAAQLHVAEVKPTEVGAALVAVFGGQASAKLHPLIEAFEKKKSAMARLNEAVSRDVGNAKDTAAAAGTCALRELDGKALFSLARELAHDPEIKARLPRGRISRRKAAAAGGASEAALPDSRHVVLVTGCQDNEESADACPTDNLDEAFGAMTNALTSVVKEFTAANPGKHISARSLVLHVRDFLQKDSYPQNPCLECEDAAADAAFILG